MQVTDDFNRADGVLVSPYEQWATNLSGVTQTPNWSVITNEISPSKSYVLTTFRHGGAFSGNHYVEFRMRQRKWTADRSMGGPAVRILDNNTMYYLQLNETALTLRSRLAGAEAWHAEHIQTFIVDVYYTLRLQAVESLITVFLDGTKVIEITDSRVSPGGKPGAHCRTGDTLYPRFDDLVAGDFETSGSANTRRRRV